MTTVIHRPTHFISTPPRRIRSVVLSQSISHPAVTLLLCPSKALVSLINLPYVTHPDTPLLQWFNGMAITRQSFNNTIKLLVRSIRLTDAQFSTHSFRIGAATTASAAGILDYLIQILGRWSSNAYQVYIHIPDSILDTVPHSLASQNC